MAFELVFKFKALLLLPSTFPSDSGNPSSSPKLKPLLIGKACMNYCPLNANKSVPLIIEISSLIKLWVIIIINLHLYNALNHVVNNFVSYKQATITNM